MLTGNLSDFGSKVERIDSSCIVKRVNWQSSLGLMPRCAAGFKMTISQ